MTTERNDLIHRLWQNRRRAKVATMPRPSPKRSRGLRHSACGSIAECWRLGYDSGVSTSVSPVAVRSIFADIYDPTDGVGATCARAAYLPGLARRAGDPREVQRRDRRTVRRPDRTCMSCPCTKRFWATAVTAASSGGRPTMPTIRTTGSTTTSKTPMTAATTPCDVCSSTPSWSIRFFDANHHVHRKNRNASTNEPTAQAMTINRSGQMASSPAPSSITRRRAWISGVSGST